MARRRFAPTGPRVGAGVPTLPRSVQGLGLPPIPRGNAPNPLGLPPISVVRTAPPTPADNITRGLMAALQSDNPYAALAHALPNDREYNLALPIFEKITRQQVSQDEGIREIADTIRKSRTAASNLAPGEQDLQMMQQMGLTPEEASATQELLDKADLAEQRPITPGQMIFRGLNVGTSTTSGFAKGELDYLQDKSGAQLLSPWTYINAIGKGFREVPGAVAEGYTYEQLISERSNPDSFLYRYALPIGITLDIVADPITYLSFGMTTPTRAVAMRGIVEAEESAANQAWKKLATRAINPNTGRAFEKHEWHEALAQSKLEMNAPWTMGDGIQEIKLRDAAKEIKKIGRAEKAAGRRGERGVSGFIGGWLAPTATMGGAGTRFAGLEIPGTARLGSALGRAARGQAIKSYEAGGLYSGAAERFVPDAALRHVSGDSARALGIYKMAQVRDLVQSTPTMFEREAESLLKQKVFEKTTTEKVIPGVKSTTGPETGLTFDFTGTFSRKENIIGEGSNVKIHDIYDDQNNLIGSVHYSDRPADPRYPSSEGELFVDSIYIRPEFRDLDNLQKLTEPIIRQAERTGQTVSMVAMNEHLGNILERVGQMRGIKTDVIYYGGGESPFLESASNLDKRGRLMPWQNDDLPLLGTPDQVERVAAQRVLGTVDQVAPFEVRQNVHRTPYSKLSKEQQRFKELYDNRINIFRQRAMEQAGYKEEKVDTLIRFYEEDNADPINVLARLQTHAELDIQTKMLMRETLRDPRFAKELEGPRTSAAGNKILREEPADGFTEFRLGNKRYAVVTPIAHALEELRNDVFTHYMLNQGPYALTGIQDFWKVMATMPNPSFHTMNFLGAVWNNHLAMVYNPMNYVKAYRDLHLSRLQTMAELQRPTGRAPLRALRGLPPKPTAEGARARQLVGGLERRRGGGRSSFVFAETERSLGRELTTLSQPRGFKERLLSVPPELEVKAGTGRLIKTPKGKFIARRTRQAVALAGLYPTGGASGLLLLPEIARFGRTHVGGPIENLVRLTAYKKYAEDPTVLKAMDAFGPPRPPGFAYEGFTKAQREAAADIGGDIVRHFQFDYSELTEFERFWAKTIFPFYTYYRKNFVVQATELIKQPRKLKAVQAMMNYISQEAGDVGEMQDLLPYYFDNLMAFQIPVPNSVRDMLGLPKDDPVYLNPKMPFVSLNLFPPLWNLFRDENTPTPQRAGQILAPIFGSVGPHALGVPGSKIMLEYLTNHQLGLNRPIDFQRASSNDYRSSYRPAPFWIKFVPKPLQNWMGVVRNKQGQPMMTASAIYMVEQWSMPFISNWGSAIAPEGATESDKGKARANMISWLTGIRIMPADMHRMSKNQAYAVKNRLEAKQSELRSRGLELSDQDAELLDIAKNAVEVAREVDDLRYEQLYGEERP